MDNKDKNKKNRLNKKEKQQLMIIIIVVIVVIIIIFSSILYKNTQKHSVGRENTKIENEIEINTSKKVNATKRIDDFKIENIQVKKENEISYIYADVVNISNTEQGNINIYISMLDEKGNEIIGFGDILPIIKPGEKTTLNIGSTDDFVNSYDLKIEKIEENKK